MSDRFGHQQPPMDCERVARDEVAEQYVSGKLSGNDVAAFEDHYFACDRCFTEVEAWRTMSAALAHKPAAGVQAVSRRVPLWMATAAAASILLISAWIVRYSMEREPVVNQAAGPTPDASRATSPQPSPALAEPFVTLAALSAIEPPPYAPMRLRGASDEAARRFQQAMTRYQARDYAGAIPDLQAAAALDARLAQAPFYLGVCLLMADDARGAVEKFNSVIALGESGYFEDAHYLLAKAQLRAGDVTAARATLIRTVALHGDREAEAKKLLDELARLDRRSGGR